MTDEMKLLMSLCDALGFEVETVKRQIPSLLFAGSYIGLDKKYKLTKKEDRPIDYLQDNMLLCMRPYILNHREDIEQGINDFDELKTLLNYFTRNS